MKKKCIFFCFFLVFTSILFSQNFIMKQYFDYDTEFSGSAGSYYLEPYSEYTYTRFMAIGESVKKYSRVNEWLLNQALNEWALMEGEYYLVLCSETIPNSYDEAVGSLIKIINKKGEYEILGAVVATMRSFIDAQDSLTPTSDQIEIDKKLGYER